MSEENEVVETQEQQQEAQPNPNESEARKFGWVPKEEWQGPEDKWKPADDFLARGKEINGFLRRDFEIVNTKLSAKEKELAELKETVQEFKVWHEETEKRAYDRAMKDLREQRKKAIELGDGDVFDAVEEQIAELEKQKPTPKQQTKQQEFQIDAKAEQAMQRFLDGNPIFATDREVQAVTDGLATLVRAENPDLTYDDFLNALAERVKTTIPHKFQNSNRERPSAVGASSDAGSGRAGTKKKGYADLPSDAKAACDKFVKQGLLTKEKYVEDYFQGE